MNCPISRSILKAPAPSSVFSRVGIGRLSAIALGALLTVTFSAGITVAGESATAEAENPAPRPVYIDLDPIGQINAVRFFGPRLLHRDEAEFRVEFPARYANMLRQGRLARPQITITDHDGKAISHARIDEDAFANAIRVDRRAAEREPEPLTLTLTAAGLGGEDRKLTARLVLADADSDADGPLPPVATESWDFEVVTEQFGRVHEDHRAELGVWLDDHNMSRTIWGKVPLWPGIEAALNRTADPWAGLRGFAIRAYPNPQLRRLQPYTIYVPESLDLTEPAPLMILLHGSGGDHRNLVADYAAGQRFEENPMLIANAGAFFQQEFRHMALNNVRWVIEDMKQKYNVDPKRIYLQGISLGGRGTLEAASLLPDTFAAISAHGVYGALGIFNDPNAAVDRHPFALAMDSRADLRSVLPNLSSTAVEMVFGLKDESTPPLHALNFIAALKRSVIPVRARPFDTGHNISIPDYDWSSTRAWFLDHQKAPPRDILHLNVTNLRFNRHAWAEVHALQRYDRVGQLSVYRLQRQPDELHIQGAGILAATLEPPFEVRRVRVAGARPLTVAPGRPIHLVWDAAGQVRVVERTPSRLTGANARRPGSSGPMWEVFSQPVIFVYDDEGGRHLAQTAALSAAWDMSWGDNRLPIMPASEVTEQMRQSNNLVLFTGPRPANAWMADTTRPYPLLAHLTAVGDHDTAQSSDAGDGSNGQEADDATDEAHEPARQRDAAQAVRRAIMRPAWAGADIRMAIAPSPWSDEHTVLWVETSADRPWRLGELGWWDRWAHADWLVGRTMTDPQGRRPLGVAVVGGGSYDHFWRPQHEMEGDFRPEVNALLHMGRGFERIRNLIGFD